MEYISISSINFLIETMNKAMTTQERAHVALKLLEGLPVSVGIAVGHAYLDRLGIAQEVEPEEPADPTDPTRFIVVDDPTTRSEHLRGKDSLPHDGDAHR